MTNRHPKLFIILGQVGAGKTTVANQLGEMLKIKPASTDSTLLKILPHPSFKDKEHSPSKEELQICYNINALLAEYMLSAGASVIIDGAFALQKQRDQIIKVATSLKIPFFVIKVVCPEKQIKERVTKRFLLKKGVGYKAYNEIKKIYQPLRLKHFTLDTSKSINPQLKAFVKKINNYNKNPEH